MKQLKAAPAADPRRPEAPADRVIHGLKDDEKKLLQQMPANAMKTVFDPETLPDAAQASARLRTKTLVASSAPANEAEAALVQLLKGSSPQGRLVVQAAPGDTHIERVTGLAVQKPSKGTLEEGAAGLLVAVLKPA